MDTSTQPSHSNSLPLAGQVAVVTGASRGIGAAIARRLAGDGAAVVVNYALSAEKAEALAGEIVASGGRAVAVQGDVADADTGAKLAEAAIAAFGRVDILVNNAGIFAIDEDAERLFRVNVLGVLDTTAAFVPHLKAGSSVVNVSSVVGRDPLPMATAYSASKAAVDAITKAHARGLGERGIRVNAVAPGYTESDMSPADGGDFHQHAKGSSPLNEIGAPEDVAAAVAYLVSPGAKFVTGAILPVDGAIRM